MILWGVIFVILLLALSGFRIANQYQRAVVLRLGEFQGIRGPGLYWLIPLAERQFKVDIRNERSQAAVAKLGAVKEGTLRRDTRTWTGHIRDTVVFSILDSEWPAVRLRLQQRLAEPTG